MSFHNWQDAIAVANGFAALKGRRHRVTLERARLVWKVTEVGPEVVGAALDRVGVPSLRLRPDWLA